jgi:Asp-tRNA(Asn)/Glu-tRNA(Gln) amidotransferase A subunit family amidase
VAERDAAIVARLRKAGAVIVGKTRTDEVGLGALTPGADDPRDPGRSVGGSSGGSAIAVAVGAVPLALATDTAGSARIPAAACGVTGLCAPADWLPTDGVSILAPSFDRLGLIAATPADMAYAWTALGGSIANQPRLIRRDDLPLADFGPPRAVVITAEAAARHHAETPAAQAQLAFGAAQSDEDVRAARARLDELGAQLRGAVGDGVLVTPTLPARPPRWDELEDADAQVRATGRLTRLCGPVNSSGLVAVSVPAGDQLIARDIPTALAAAIGNA